MKPVKSDYPERYLQDFEEGCGRLLAAIINDDCPNDDEWWESVGKFRDALGKLFPHLIELERSLDSWKADEQSRQFAQMREDEADRAYYRKVVGY
jgi:hypothetical protein